MKKRAASKRAPTAESGSDAGSIEVAIAEARRHLHKKEYARSATVTRALAANKDPNAVPEIFRTLESLVGGPVRKRDVPLKDRLLALVLVEALRRRKVKDPRIALLWTDSPRAGGQLARRARRMQSCATKKKPLTWRTGP